MAKLTQAQVKDKINEWAALAKKIERAESAMKAEVEPLLRKYEADARPILERHEPKIKKLLDRQFEIEAEVLGWLNGVGKPIALDGETAVAVNEVIVCKRVISVQQFFDRVKERSSAFWDCVSIGVAKAEKLIGKKAVDEVSTKETKLVASLKLK